MKKLKQTFWLVSLLAPAQVWATATGSVGKKSLALHLFNALSSLFNALSFPVGRWIALFVSVGIFIVLTLGIEFTEEARRVYLVTWAIAMLIGGIAFLLILFGASAAQV